MKIIITVAINVRNHELVQVISVAMYIFVFEFIGLLQYCNNTHLFYNLKTYNLNELNLTEKVDKLNYFIKDMFVSTHTYFNTLFVPHSFYIMSTAEPVFQMT